MGPRSHERGNGSQMAAYSDVGLASMGGRVLMNAETSVADSWDSVTGKASMGPRSHERGNSPDSKRASVV